MNIEVFRNIKYFINFLSFISFYILACPRQTYKASSGNEECIACGQNAKDGEAPRTICACLDGYFKKVKERNDMTADCFRK